MGSKQSSGQNDDVDDAIAEDAADEENESRAEGPATDDVEDDVEESAADDGGTAAPPPIVVKKRGGFVAWLALLLGGAALAGLGYDFLRDRGTASEAASAGAAVTDLAATVRGTRDMLNALEARVEESASQQVARDAALETLRREVDGRLRDLEAMSGRVASIESALSSLQGVSAGARDAWLLAEAEYYMQIANAQLQLARNPQLAGLALRLADERIQQLGDPRLTDVRRALSNELRSLDVIERPDTAGISLTLASLAAVVDSLPLKREVATRESDRSAVDPSLSGMDRAWATLRNAVDGVVSVRRTDEAMEPLIAPEAEYFLRANLALQLQTARLALLRGEQTIFEQSLDDAASWLAEYYDEGSQAVQSAQETIADIRENVLSVETPDISLSLRLLRQFNALSEAEGATEAGTEQ